MCYCQNPKCRVALQLDANDAYWWCDNASYKIVCKKCGHRFDTKIDYLTYINQDLYSEPAFYTDGVRKRMLSAYVKTSQCLNEYHEQRQNFAQVILAAGMPDDTALCRAYADVLLDNLNASRERFGTHSLEFIMAATYALDYLALIKNRSADWKNDPEEYAALQLFDLGEMKNAFGILSSQTKEVFDNYVKEYLEIGSA